MTNVLILDTSEEVMSKKLSIRTEYGAWPIWDVDYFGYIDPAQLPLAEDTVKRLLTWQMTLDTTLDEEYPPNSGFSSEDERIAWRQEGIVLWQQVQKELEPEYEVYYYLYYNGKQYFLRHLEDLKQFPL